MIEVAEEKTIKVYTEGPSMDNYTRMLNICNIYGWLEWAEKNFDKTKLKKEEIVSLKKMLTSKDPADQDLAIELFKKLKL